MKAQSVAAEVEAIRESLAGGTSFYRPRFYAVYACDRLAGATKDVASTDVDLEAIELWARLAADLAGLLQRGVK
jgi:hypothetical protein